MTVWRPIGKRDSIAPAGDINAGADFAARWQAAHYFRMADTDLFGEKKFYNNLVLNNNDATDAVIRFSFSQVEALGSTFTIPAKTTFILTPDDGIIFWGFDLLNSGNVANITAANITGFAWRTDPVLGS